MGRLFVHAILENIQAKYLRKVRELREKTRQPCLHDGCDKCHGTGIKLDGSRCVHMISCPCRKCNPYTL